MQLAPTIQAKSEYKRFLFTYLFGGREWSLEVPALTLEEARERVRVLPFARCNGEFRGRRVEPAPAAARRTGWFRKAG